SHALTREKNIAGHLIMSPSTCPPLGGSRSQRPYGAPPPVRSRAQYPEGCLGAQRPFPAHWAGLVPVSDRPPVHGPAGARVDHLSAPLHHGSIVGSVPVNNQAILWLNIYPGVVLACL